MIHIRHHNRKLLIGLLLFLGTILLFLPAVALAQEQTLVGGFIYRIATGIGGTMLWIAGGLFDYVTITLVIGMGDLIRQGEGLGGTIEQMWSMVRDIFNLLFIFGIIYIGFRVILFSEDSNIHKTLGWLIVAALMINFSLFITQAVVDFSNATSYQIYTKMITSSEIESSENTEADGSTTPTKTIGATYMNFMKLTTYAKNAALENTDSEEPVPVTKAAFYGIMMMFLMLIAAFVFAAGAFMFFARFVALIFFMILSPAMFVGMIFPFFQQYQKMWWDRFLRYAFVAPAFLFMTYLSVQLLARTGLEPDNPSAFAEAFEASSWIEGSFMVFLYFFLVIGFFIASLYLANQMGVYGATGSMKIVQGAGKYIQSSAKGFVGRNTVGRVSGAGQWANDKLEMSRGGRIFKGALTTASLGTFDERTRQKLTTAGLNANFGSSRSRADDKKWSGTLPKQSKAVRNIFGLNPDETEQEKRRNKLQQEKNTRATVRKNNEEFNGQVNTIRNDDTEAKVLDDTIKELGKTIKKMSDNERADLGLDKLKSEVVAVHLSDDHISSLEKTGQFSHDEISDIKQARENAQIHIAAEGTFNKEGTTDGKVTAQFANATSTEHQTAMRQLLVGRGTRDVGKSSTKIFQEPAMYEHITPAMVEERMRNGVSQTDLDKMREAFNKNWESKHSVEVMPDLFQTEQIPESNPWGKWQKSNSVYAAQFFADE